MVRELFGCFLAYLWKVKSNTVIPYNHWDFVYEHGRSKQQKNWGCTRDYCASYMFLVVLKIFLNCSTNSEVKPALRLLALRVLQRRCYCNQRWMLKSLCGSIKTSIKLNKIHIFTVCDPCLIPKSKLKKHSVVMLLLQRIHFTKNLNNIIFSQRNVLRILYSLLKAKTIVATLRGGLGCDWPASFK